MNDIIRKNPGYADMHVALAAHYWSEGDYIDALKVTTSQYCTVSIEFIDSYSDFTRCRSGGSLAIASRWAATPTKTGPGSPLSGDGRFRCRPSCSNFLIERYQTS